MSRKIVAISRFIILVFSLMCSQRICCASSEEENKKNNTPSVYIVDNDKVIVANKYSQNRKVINLERLLYRLKEYRYSGIDKRYDDATSFMWINPTDCVMVSMDELLLYCEFSNSFIAIKNIWGDPQIHYIIGLRQSWDKYGYGNYVIESDIYNINARYRLRVDAFTVKNKTANSFEIYTTVRNRFSSSKGYKLLVDLVHASTKIVLPEDNPV